MLGPTIAARRRGGLLTAAHLALLAAAALSIVVAQPLGRLMRQEQYWQIGLLVLLSGLIFYGIADEQHPFHWLMVVAPALAFVPLPGRPYLGPVGRVAFAAVLVTALTHVVFFGEDRYYLFLSPLLCAFRGCRLA